MATALSVSPSSVTLGAVEGVEECDEVELSSTPIAPVIRQQRESIARGSSKGASSRVGNGGAAAGNTPEEVLANTPGPPSPIHVVATGGVDGPTCGRVEAPCATLRYTVNAIANGVAPSSVIVPIAAAVPTRHGR